MSLRSSALHLLPNCIALFCVCLSFAHQLIALGVQSTSSMAASSCARLQLPELVPMSTWITSGLSSFNSRAISSAVLPSGQTNDWYRFAGSMVGQFAGCAQSSVGHVADVRQPVAGTRSICANTLIFT